MAKIKLDKEPKGYETNEENLFVLNKSEKCFKISMYNHNLEMVQTFGQEYLKRPFFFSLKTFIFLTSNQYFIFTEPLNNQVAGDEFIKLTIINRSNGLVYSSFVILVDFDQLQLYLDKYFLTFNRVTCFLKCYNFKGDLLSKIDVDTKLKGSYLSANNKELCFNLKNDKIFIF